MILPGSLPLYDADVRQTFGAARGQRQPNPALADFARQPPKVSCEKAAARTQVVVLSRPRTFVDDEMKPPSGFPTKGGRHLRPFAAGQAKHGVQSGKVPVEAGTDFPEEQVEVV